MKTRLGTIKNLVLKFLLKRPKQNTKDFKWETNLNFYDYSPPILAVRQWNLKDKETW